MGRSVRRVSLAAAGCVSLAALTAHAVIPTGLINLPTEQEAIDDLLAAKQTEQQARDLVSPYFTSTVPPDVGTAVSAKLAESVSQLNDLKEGLENNLAAFGPNAVVSDALQSVEAAVKSDEQAISALAGKKAKKKGGAVLDSVILTAMAAKDDAIRAIQGTPTTSKDHPAVAANPVGVETVVYDADIASQRKFWALTQDELDSGIADFQDALARVLFPRPSGGGGGGGWYKTTKPPKNYYFAFEGTTANPGYVFKSLQRPLMGPVEVKFQVGVFESGATGDTGSACVEFDLEGSSPLQFLAVCGRRVNGGVQVFAQSHTGAQGSLFLVGASIAQVRVQYSGTAFTCSAGEGAGAPDFALSNFSTYNFAQGSTPLIPGLGASGLTKGAVIGLDEVYITPR